MKCRIIAISCIALLLLVACKPKDHQPLRNSAISAAIPFSINKAGNVAKIDFQAQPGAVDLKKTYMVKLTFDRAQNRDPLSLLEGRPPRTLLPIKAKVTRIDGKSREAVTIMDNSQFLGNIDIEKYPGTTPENPKEDVVYAFLYGSTGTHGYICIARFNLSSYGHYQVEIETVQDQPIFDNVKSSLTIEERFNLGE